MISKLWKYGAVRFLTGLLAPPLVVWWMWFSFSVFATPDPGFHLLNWVGLSMFLISPLTALFAWLSK
jgi:hypothetical protein